MIVVITGGAGYLGSVLCQKLLEAGHSVRVLDSLLYGGGSLLASAGHPEFKLLEGDIRDETCLTAVLSGAHAVVHLAAVVGDPACARDPRTADDVNRRGSLNLIEAAEAHGVDRFLFASTCSNYGRMQDTSVLAEEDDELRPVSLYAETKVAVERRLLTEDTRRMCPVVYRFATLYGLSPRMRLDLTVNEFTWEMYTRGKLTVFGEQFWRPYVHVRDAAACILRGLNAPAEVVDHQVFNVGSTSENYRKVDLVNLIQSRLSGKADVTFVSKAEDPRDYRVSFEKLRRTLGFVPTHKVTGGVEEIIIALEHRIFGAAPPATTNLIEAKSLEERPALQLAL